LRQIVPHHDVDPDLLLFTQDRFAAGEREQHAHGGARLMPRVLRNCRIHHALQEQLAGQDRHVVADENHLRPATGIDQRLGDALRAGSDIVA